MNVSIKLGVGETEEQLKPLAEKKLKQKFKYFRILKKYHVTLFDFKNELNKFKDYLIYETNIDSINKLIVDIENKESNEIEYCFINLSSKNIDKDLCDKLRYLISLSLELPFYFIVRLDGYLVNDHYFYDAFSYLMTFDNDSKEVLKLFGFNHSNGLLLGEEGLIKNLDLVMRVAIGGVKLEEMKKIEQ